MTTNSHRKMVGSGIRGRSRRPILSPWCFASAPAAMVPGEVADAVRELQRAYLERCGLKSG